MDDLQLLEAVEERLTTHGWAKGTWGAMEGPNCLLGAAERVGYYDAWDVQKMMRERLGLRTTVIKYNDTPWRMRWMVMRRLRKAIKRLRKEREYEAVKRAAREAIEREAARRQEAELTHEQVADLCRSMDTHEFGLGGD